MQIKEPKILGVLPSQSISELILKKIIFADKKIEKGQVQPASLDLRLGNVAWRIRASFLTGKDKNVSDLLNEFEMHQIDLTKGAVLEKGCVYLIPIEESLKLLRPGMCLNQIRFRQGQAILTDEELLILHKNEKLIDTVPKIDAGLGFSVDLQPAKGSLVGYQAKPHTGIIDLDNIKTYKREDFWQEVHSTNGQIILDPDAFYILVSREAVHIPPAYAAEMAPYLAMVGEFRVHYAGFFDPGFGHAHAGGSGSRGVLEVRCHEAPFVLEHGQIVGRLVYERMASIPKELYGENIKSNYQGQGLKLSKHFK